MSIRGFKKENSGSNEFNTLSFLIERMLAQVFTIKLVRVKTVDIATGSLSCTPLVSNIDGEGNAISGGIYYDVPYVRIQGGSSGLICDPAINDIGIIMFCDRDSTGAIKTKKEGLPSSLEVLGNSSPVYIGATLFSNPSVYVKITNNGIEIKGNTQILNNTTITGKLTVDDLDVSGSGKIEELEAGNGATGVFVSQDGKAVTVTKGIVTQIV